MTVNQKKNKPEDEIDVFAPNENDVLDSTQVPVANKEEKILTSEYVQKKLTNKEEKAAEDLASSFNVFLKDTFDIAPDTSIKTTIPTGIDLLDTLAGGGFATSLVQIVGMPGSGKTALAVKVLSSGQRKWPGKFLGVFGDAEEAMSTERLSQLGVTSPSINPTTDLTVEKVFKIIEGLCIFKDEHPELLDVPHALVWDSIANTLTEKGTVSDNVDSVLGEKARVLSHYLPKYVRKLNKYNISLVAINQIRDKIDMGLFKTAPDLKFLGDKNLPGGKSVLFNSVQLLLVKAGKNIQGEYGFNGFTVAAKFVKNKLFSPNIDFELVFSFERGFSNFWTNFQMLKKFKRVQAGAWCKLVDYPEQKFRQKDAIKYYREDPKFKAVWDREVIDTIQKEYIDTFGSTDMDTTEVF